MCPSALHYIRIPDSWANVMKCFKEEVLLQALLAALMHTCTTTTNATYHHQCHHHCHRHRHHHCHHHHHHHQPMMRQYNNNYPSADAAATNTIAMSVLLYCWA